MVINVKRLLDINGAEERLNCEIDLSSASQLRASEIPNPVKLDIGLKNQATVLTLEYKASFLQNCVCDRCLKEEQLARELCFNHTVVRNLNGTDMDDYLVVPDDLLDIAEVAANDIRLELPIWYLCKDDCKGLCPVCGSDLNCKECGCEVKTVDPRLEILKKLL